MYIHREFYVYKKLDLKINFCFIVPNISIRLVLRVAPKMVATFVVITIVFLSHFLLFTDKI